jgi:hypothetical protein
MFVKEIKCDRSTKECAVVMNDGRIIRCLASVDITEIQRAIMIIPVITMRAEDQEFEPCIREEIVNRIKNQISEIGLL